MILFKSAKEREEHVCMEQVRPISLRLVDARQSKPLVDWVRDPLRLDRLTEIVFLGQFVRRRSKNASTARVGAPTNPNHPVDVRKHKKGVYLS